jgi:DNA polymerase-3 subunit delta
MAEDIRTLAKVSRALQSSANLAGALRDARVWGVRQKLVERAVRRFTPSLAERALRQAAQIDKLVKGLRQGDVWDELMQLGIRCARAGARTG